MAAALLTAQVFQFPNLSTHRDATVESEVRAPADDVWRLLTDLPGYTRWNPYIYPASGQVAEGAKLELRLHDTTQVSDIIVTVQRVTPDREVVFGGSLLGVRRTFTFTIDDSGTGTVHVTGDEQFTGLLLPLAGGIADQAQAGLAEMVSALRTTAEIDLIRPAKP